MSRESSKTDILRKLIAKEWDEMKCKPKWTRPQKDYAGSYVRFIQAFRIRSWIAEIRKEEL